MVSVDGEVDQPLRLRDWLATFDPTILGMTGAREEVRRIGEEFGLYLANGSQPGLLDHSTSSFLIDRDGRLRTTFTVGTSPTVIATTFSKCSTEDAASAPRGRSRLRSCCCRSGRPASLR